MELSLKGLDSKALIERDLHSDNMQNSFKSHLKYFNDHNITQNSKFIFLYFPKLQICTIITDYNKSNIIELLSIYQKDYYLIVHINNDDSLSQIVLESKFSTSILSDLSKITDITIDYCFSPVEELLFLNFSLFENCDYFDYNKFNTQMYFVNNGLYIVNRKGFFHIFEIMMTKFYFDFVDKEVFFDSLSKLSKNQRESPLKRKRSSSAFNLKSSSYNLNLYDSNNNINKTNSKNAKKFFSDKLIYWLLVSSLEKLEEFSDQVTKELTNLYQLYLDLPLKERKPFYKRLHSTEMDIEMIHEETKMKKKFIDFILAHGNKYSKLTYNYFFQNNFDLLLDLIMSKITQLEFLFERYECTINLIKDNFQIIIEDNENQGTITFNNTMKILTILTTLYTPLNIISGIMSMNISVPFNYNESQNFNAFFTIIFLIIVIDGLLIYFFKRYKWL